MNTIIDLCFLCTKDYNNCVPVIEKIVSQVEYLLPEITVIKLGVPLRICSVCDGALCAFSKFKQSSVESSRRLEASIKGAQGPPLHTGSPPVVDDIETSFAKPEKIEEIFIVEEHLEETPLDTQMHTDRASLNPDLLKTISAEPQNQNTNTNADNIEQIFIKEERMEETPQDREYYNKILKTECDIETEDKRATLNTEICEVISSDSEEEILDSNKQEIRCNVCGKLFTNTSALNIHKKIHSFNCNICSKAFVHKRSFDIHMKIHSMTDNLPEHNTEDNTNTNVLQEKPEIQLIAIIKSYQCPVCNKSLTTKTAFDYHMSIHTGIKDYHCDICGKSFPQKSHLNYHKKVHERGKEFQCNVCGKEFAHKYSLSSHKKIHSDVKDFQCEICNKSFTYKCSLAYHMKLHSGIKDFRCDVCGRSFTQKSSLTAHGYIHTRKRFK